MNPEEISKKANVIREKLQKTETVPSTEKTARQLKLNTARKKWRMPPRFESFASFFLIFGCLFTYIYLTDEWVWALYIATALFTLMLLTVVIFIAQKLVQANKN